MSDQIALVVEDTPANLDFFERLIKQAGFTILCAETGGEAFEAISDVDHLALAVLDMEIPDMSGLQLIAQVRQLYPEVCIVVATMHDQDSVKQAAFSRGCNVFLVKPHGFMELFSRLTTLGAEGMRDGDLLIIDQYGPRPFHAQAG